MAFVIPSIFTVIDKLSAPMKGMTRNVEQFNLRVDTALSRQERLFRKLTPAISETQKQFLSLASSAAIAGAIIAGGAFSAKSMMDYETELANLQAVTGASGNNFETFKGKIKDVATETKKSAIDVAKAFTAIANNQPELLKDADALAAVTKSSILLAQASRMELQPAGEALTTILNQFGKGAKDAASTVGILAAGSVAGSSEINDTSEAIQKFGAVAANTGIKINESVALIELASKFQKGSEAGEKLRNILILMSTAKVQDPKALKDMERLHVNMKLVMNSAVPLSDRLKEMSKVAGDNNALFHIFGKENQTMATALLNSVGSFDSMLTSVGTLNVAEAMAAKNNATFAVSIQQLKDKFVTWLVTSDSAASALDTLRKAAIFVADNLDTILKTVGWLVGAFLAWKAALLIGRIYLFLYNVVLGVSNALTATSTVYTEAQTVASYAQNIATKILTIAQWDLNAAMEANPIGIVILAVAGLTAGIYLLINAQDELDKRFQTSVEASKADQLKKQRLRVDELTNSYIKQGMAYDVAHAKAVQHEKVVNDARVANLNLQAIQQQSKSDNMNGFLNFMNGSEEGKQNEQRAKEIRGALEIALAAKTDLQQQLNPKAAQQNATFSAFQTNNASVDINIRDPGNMLESASAGGQDFVNVQTTSTLK